MITVNILINGEAIFARTAVNVGKNIDGSHSYKVDDGTTIKHYRREKAVALAIKMLETIKEPEGDKSK